MKDFIKLFLATLICANIYATHSTAQIANYENDLLSLKYEFLESKLSQSVSGKDWFISIPGFDKIKGTGIPALPHRVEKFEVPEGSEIAGVDFEVICDTIDITYELAEPLQLMNEETSENTYNEIIIEDDVYWPESWGYIMKTQNFRGVQIGNIAILPIRYNAAQRKAIVCSQINVNIHFNSTFNDKLRSKSAIKHSRVADIMKGFISIPDSESYESSEELDANYNLSSSVIKSPLNPMFTKSPLFYLIISPEEFSQQAERLAIWKRRMGYNVEVKTAKRSFLKDPSYTKQLIENSYQKEQNMEYVLLLGDGDQIRPCAGINKYDNRIGYHTDYYFGCMDDDNDYMTDLFIGRLPARDLSEAEIMVSKTIDYEQDPPINNHSYFNSGLNCSLFENHGCTEIFDDSSDNWEDPIGLDCSLDGMEIKRFIRTSEDIATYMQSKGYSVNRVYYTADDSYPMRWSYKYSDGGMIPSYLRKPNYSWTGCKDDIISQINKGAFYLFYTWHGDNNLWGTSKFTFLENSDIPKLDNAGAYPIVFASTCLSGKFYHPLGVQNEGRSLSETLLGKADGGAAGIIAFSDKCFTEITDAFSTGLFDAIFPNPGLSWNGYSDPIEVNPTRTPVKELSKIMFLANERAFQAFADFNPNPDSSLIITRYLTQSLYNKEVAHCLGDPSLKVFTGKPQKIQISKSIVNGSELYIDPRNLVAVNKSTNDVFYIKGPIREYLGPLMNDYYLSFVADGYVPSLLNEEAGNIINTNAAIKKISRIGSDLQIFFEDPLIDCTLTITDINGKLIKSIQCSGSECTIPDIEQMGIITLSKLGIVLDSKTFAK